MPRITGMNRNGEQRHSTHGRTQDAPDDDSPAAAGEVANHDNRHGAESDAQPAHKAEQVGAIELVGPNEGEDDGDNAEDDADDQGPLRNGLDHWRRCQIELFYGRRAHFPSPVLESVSGRTTGMVAPEPGSRNFGGSDGIFWPAGTSAIVAFWLSCRART